MNRQRNRWGRARRLFAKGVLGIATAGIASRLVGDTTLPTALLIYATPWLVVLGGGATVVITDRGWWRWPGLALAGWGLAGGVRSWCPPASARFEGTLTIATWNAGRDLDESPAHWHFESDVVAVIESGSFDKQEWQRFNEATPDYAWRRAGSGILLGLRDGEVIAEKPLNRRHRFDGHHVELEIRGRRLVVVVVDIHAQPWLKRAPSIHALFESVAGQPNAIVLGDFNTPPESRAFDDARDRGFRLANHTQSGGFIETWAYGIPLLTLDHIWVGPGLKALLSRQQRRDSDHALVEATIRFNDPWKPSKSKLAN